MCALLLLATSLQAADANWEPAGWGGGGFFYSAAFHPTRDGVIYMGGDVNGAYRSDDHGKSWKIINNGISGYGVFTIAVDPSSPETVWAATDEGLSKSTDAGESWKTIAKSAKKDLRLTGEKNKSIHNVAVDPTNGKIVYIGTPHGKIYKTTDGGETWAQIYERAYAADPVASTRLQFGGSSDAIFGGFWMPVKFPRPSMPPTPPASGSATRTTVPSRATSSSTSAPAPGFSTEVATCTMISRPATGATSCCRRRILRSTRNGSRRTPTKPRQRRRRRSGRRLTGLTSRASRVLKASLR